MFRKENVKLYFIIPLLLAGLLILVLGTKRNPSTPINNFSGLEQEKIDGVSFVASNVYIEAESMLPIQELDANWVAVMPYGFSYPDKPQVIFDEGFQWWGEKTEGAVATLQYAKSHGYKIMLKPHIWVLGQGWAGDFDLDNEKDLDLWEKEYSDYILHYARIADSMDIELFCIGTEFRKLVVHRPDFWPQLIKNVKKVYRGKLTYAANWDNYHNVGFWDELDYIGIDAYFPLLDAGVPDVEGLLEAWNPWYEELRTFSEQHQKQILFTEYGYMSVERTAWRNWENEKNMKDLSVNHEAQKNAFEALYIKFWSEKWFAGGFIWKWYHYHNAAGGLHDKDYTPQNKPVTETIRKYYMDED